MNEKKIPLYKAIAIAISARENCIKSGNTEWQDKHEESLWRYQALLPKGSGFDMGTAIDWEKSNRQKIVLNGHYHKMDENGFYDRWIDFRVVVTPSLQFDFDLKFVGNFGKDQDLKEYLYCEFEFYLNEFVKRR